MKYDTLGIDLTKSYGFDFDNYDTSKLPELPEEEKKKWYSKYYYQGRPELPEDVTKIFARGNMMDPKHAMLPGTYDQLTQKYENENDIGYCLLRNGVGYGSTRTLVKGVNVEMFEWYRKLRLVDKLSYKIWYPGAHESEVGGKITEDVGFGVSNFLMLSTLEPKMLGITMVPEETDKNFAFIIGANAVIKNRDNPEIRPLASALFHYVRKTEDGSLDFRTHFLMGGMIIEGRLIRMQRIEPDICLEITRRMCSHCFYERSNMQNFLPELYDRREEFTL